eukprot:5459398-Pyramimonas_sp.AAC.1
MASKVAQKGPRSLLMCPRSRPNGPSWHQDDRRRPPRGLKDGRNGLQEVLEEARRGPNHMGNTWSDSLTELWPQCSATWAILKGQGRQ